MRIIVNGALDEVKGLSIKKQTYLCSRRGFFWGSDMQVIE
jgi:hypothetical protein